jgi:hypothetical protein
MPVLIRWYLKAALIYLVAALGVGIVLAGQSVFNLPGFVRSLMPVYLHLFMVGWISQLIFGVVLWMFPKYSPTTAARQRKYSLADIWVIERWINFTGSRGTDDFGLPGPYLGLAPGCVRYTSMARRIGFHLPGLAQGKGPLICPS